MSELKTIDMVHIALFAALMAICSWISIPATIPFTMQTFGVFMAVLMLGGYKGTLAILVYIILGAIGLPVFAGFSGGLSSLFGSAGGYIMGFLFSGLSMWMIEKWFGNSAIVQMISMIVGLIVCYVFGTVWFMFVYGSSNILLVLGWCVFPFIIPDLLKMALVFVMSNRLKRII
ncbi:MAG: biotin transporter BioY [Erysipelotrichaceae bacterium]|nr:biotin transporter BioY [Erysipelotrichaceae bacterium]